MSSAEKIDDRAFAVSGLISGRGGEGDVATAAEYAPILVKSTADLDAKVNDTSNFNSDVAFAGMMALANEVRLNPGIGQLLYYLRCLVLRVRLGLIFSR